MSLATLFLSVTRKCNLSCTYCSADAGPDQTEALSLEAALRHVDDWLLRSADEPQRQLVFSGGEPTLWGYERLDAVCARAHAHGVKIGMQTNATTIGERFVRWCRDWDVEPSISLDGPPWLSDERRGLGERVETGLLRLRDEGIGFAVIVCLSKRVIDNIEAVLDYFADKGFSKLRMNTLGDPPRGRMIDAVNAGDLLRAKQAIYRRVEGGLDELNVKNQVAWFDAWVTNQPVVHGHCTRARCGAGSDVAAINPDGSVAPCIERSMTGGLPIADDLARLPVLMNDYWGEWTDWAPCRSCAARPICDHGCPVYHRLEHERFDAECEANRAFFAFLVEERAARVVRQAAGA